MTETLALISLRVTSVFAESYRSLVSEFVERGEKLVPSVLAFPNDHFAALVESLHPRAQGHEPPERRLSIVPTVFSHPAVPWR